MLKKIHTKARPRIFKPSVTKSRWKSNVCVALAGFLLLLSVSLLHTKLGAEGTDSKKKDNSVEVSKFSKFSGARKELINRGDFGKERVERNGKDGVLDNSEHVTLRSGDDDLGKANGSFRAGNGEERRENLEINEKEESDEEEDAKDRDEDGDYDLGNNEMEDFDGFDEDPEDKIDEMDEVDEKEDDDEGVRSQRQDKGSEDIDTEKSSSNRRTGHEKDSIRKEGEENVPLSEDLSRGRKNWNGKQDNSEDSKVREKSIEKLREIDEGKINSEKRLERLGLIQTIPRRNSSEERKKIEKSPYLIPIQTKTAAGEISRKGRAGLFWDHVVGVTRKAFLKHPQRQGSSRLKQRDFSNAETEQGFDIRTEGEWEDTFVDESVTGNNDRSKEAFSSDDEPIDEGIRNLLEEVTGIEDALLLKGSERSSSLRSGWGPWFDSIQRRASKSDFMRRDRMARSTVDLLNPLNNPLLQDPDAIGPAGLTKSDKAILKALKKSSIEGIPFVGEQLSHSKELPEKTLVEETDIQSKGQVQDAVALQKTLEENNLDGGDEASVKERNNSDNDDDASLKTELTQLTRKALDENDSNRTNLQRIRGNNIRRNFPKATRGIGQTRSRRSAQVERKELSHKKGLRENTRLLGENFEGEKQEAHKIISRRNILPLQKKGSGIEEDTTRRLHSLSALELQESKHQPSLGSRSFSADGTLAANVNSSGPSDKIVNNGGLLSSDNRASSNEHLDADEDIMVMSNKNTDAGDFITHKGDKTLGTMENKKIQRQGESKRLKSVTRNKVQKKHRHNGDTRRWGYFPGLDPHLSFSEFMDEFLGHGNCSLRVFMAWTTPPWSYTVRYQRGLESLLYFHPGACVVVFSDSIELDFFNDFVRDGYRVAVVMPNLDELLDKTPSHVFSSVWLDWRKVNLYYLHYTELLRLAALYKYGGVYLDSDVIVLKALDSLNNTVGTESLHNGELSLNGAVMAFEIHSPFLLECLIEFTATYDDTLLRWNGAELLTRVAKRSIEQSGESWAQLKAIQFQSPWAFFPLSFHNISSYFVVPDDEYDREIQVDLLKRILNESYALHFWNGLTSKLVPETGSLVERVLNYNCLHCTDFL